MKVSILSAILAVVACGGTALDGPTGPSASCTITLSGAVSATLKCAAAEAAYSSANNEGGITLTAVPSGTVQSFTMALGTTGQPQTTTYTLANTLAGTGIVLASSSSQFWTATSSTGGTLSAQVTDLGNSTSANTGTAWLSIHGSVNATLQAQSGTSATGTVTVVASF